MAFHPVQHCTMCKLRWQVDTNLCENTFAFYWGTPVPTAAELNSLAAAVAANLGTRLANAVCNNVTFRTVHCENINAPGGAQGNYNFPPGTIGRRNQSPVALNEASGIVKYTGFVGRSNRGRNSISAFGEQDVSGNTLTTALMTLLADLALGILQSYFTGRFLPAVASKANNIAIPLQSTAVLDTNVDSQKTRLNAHGT